VLFADVVASTELAEGLDPEDWAAIMNQAFEVLSRATTRYEGTVARLTGDGILAFFGAPTAHEDDPERAVRAALDMLSDLTVLNDRVGGMLPRPLEIRVGIDTGLVVVGDMGSAFRSEYTAMGDAPNVASRMQALAEPGTIVVTGATYARVAHLIEARDLGLVQVKGKREPVRALAVGGIRSAPGRARGIAGLHSPMVGRNDELERLYQTFDTARSGRGRVAMVIGEPGIGKTRLVEELRARVEREAQVAWIEARCVTYGRNMPYHLLLELVRALAFGHGSARVSEAGLRSWSEGLLGDAAGEVWPYLAHLLGLPVTDSRLTDRDPEALHGHYIDALGRVLRAVATTPLVVVAEDLHWADPSSARALVQLVPVVASAPVLLVCTSRDERDTPGWEFRSEAERRLGGALVELVLAPLSSEASSLVVGHLLEIESLPVSVRELILAKAEGNPFFVEEVVRMLIDRGVIVREGTRWIAGSGISEIEIPTTLHALLSSRLDRLGASAKDTLQVAAVVGRRFAPELVEDVQVRAGTAHGDSLMELEAPGLVVPVRVGAGIEYAFRHALVHDTAYASLLRHERQRLHGLVGAALEERSLDPDGADAAELARHFEEAEDLRAGARYLIAAGAYALQRSAPREAHGLFERALTLLDRAASEPWAARPRVEATLGRVSAGYTFIPYDQARGALEAILPLAEELADEQLIARSVLWLVRLRVEQGDVGDESFAHRLEQVTSLAERLEDVRLVATLHAVLGLVDESSRFRSAAHHFQLAAQLFEAQENLREAAYNCVLAAAAYAHLGEFGRADDLAARAERLATGVDDANLRLDIDIIRGMVEQERGDVERAMALTERGVSLALEVGNTRCLAVGSFYLGAQRLLVGDTSGAISALEQSEGAATFCSMVDVANMSQLWLATARAALGTAHDRASIDIGLERARALGDRLGEAQAHRHRARAATASERPDLAALREDFEAALRIFEELEARPALARTLHEYGRALADIGAPDAGDTIARAEALSAQLGLVQTGSAAT
jgi:predicted ATPase/class 3 adenylate cyclase